MKTFLDLLDTDLKLHICVNGDQYWADLHSPLEFNGTDCVTVDGIEILPCYRHLIVEGVLTIPEPFYQWLHRVTGQGWLLRPYFKNS